MDATHTTSQATAGITSAAPAPDAPTPPPRSPFPPRPHMPAPGEPPLTRLSDEDGEWITEYLQGGRCPFQLAALVNQSIATILNWYAQPHIQNALELLDKSAVDRSRLESIENLRQSLKETEDPVESRRINTAILRACNQHRRPRYLLSNTGAPPQPTRGTTTAPHPTAPHAPTAPAHSDPSQLEGKDTQPPPIAPNQPHATQHSALSTQHSAPLSTQHSSSLSTQHSSSTAPAPSLPSPDNDPRQQLTLLAEALNRTGPWPHLFARTICNFLSPRTTHTTEPFETFALQCREQFPLRGYDFTIEVGPIRTKGDLDLTTATIRYTYIAAGRQSHFQFEMSRTRDGPHPNTWLIDTITTLKRRELIRP
jgi:hypothetical protein